MEGTGSTASPTSERTRAALKIGAPQKGQASTTATTTLLELIDWNRLPLEAKAVARRLGPMLCDGYSVKEIARSLGRNDDWVSARIKILRDAIKSQISDQLDGMEADLRAHIERLMGR
jgi:hypothetical protein